MDEKELIGWVAFYNGKRLEIIKGKDATSLYGAKLYAIEYFRVPKSKQNSGDLAIEPGYAN